MCSPNSSCSLNIHIRVIFDLILGKNISHLRLESKPSMWPWVYGLKCTFQSAHMFSSTLRSAHHYFEPCLGSFLQFLSSLFSFYSLKKVFQVQPASRLISKIVFKSFLLTESQVLSYLPFVFAAWQTGGKKTLLADNKSTQQMDAVWRYVPKYSEFSSLPARSCLYTHTLFVSKATFPVSS